MAMFAQPPQEVNPDVGCAATVRLGKEMFSSNNVQLLIGITNLQFPSFIEMSCAGMSALMSASL